ncbi:MAG: DUF433 domain-containing protein [Bacteroidota bacterium]
MTSHNRPYLGGGIFTLPDIGQILKIPYNKVHRWIKEYWDTILAHDFEQTYSWHDGNSRAVSFHTLMELVVFSQLHGSGVKPKKILEAHKELSEKFDTMFPFASFKVIRNMFSDGSKIYFKDGEDVIYSMGSHRQLNLKFIVDFFKNIDFGDDELAARFWPMGRENAIVVDPKHQFGQPVIDGTNITADALYSMNKAGDPPKYIAYLYEIEEKQVLDAIEFCKPAA